MATEETCLIRNERRRAMICELLSQQCRAGCWDNASIIDKIRSADLAPALTLENVCSAVRAFEEQRLADEINEIYFNSFWLGGLEEESVVASGLY